MVGKWGIRCTTKKNRKNHKKDQVFDDRFRAKIYIYEIQSGMGCSLMES